MKTSLILLVVLVLAASVLAKKPAKNKRVNCKKGSAKWTPCTNGMMKQTFTPTDAACNATTTDLQCPSVMSKEKNGCTLTRTDAIQECATSDKFTRTYTATGTCSMSAKPAKKLPCSKPYKSNADRAAKKAAKKAAKMDKKAKKVNKKQKARAGGNA